MKRRKKSDCSGALLIATLFLSLILLIMGMALLGIRASQKKSAVETGYSIQARHFAEAGMEDAKIKLQKCINFPESLENQDEFSYREEITDFNGKPLGIYCVTIDLKSRESAKFVSVTTVGISGVLVDNPSNEEGKSYLKIGSDGTKYLKPLAKRVIMATMPTDDPTDTSIVPNYGYKYINYRDGGSY